MNEHYVHQIVTKIVAAFLSLPDASINGCMTKSYIPDASRDTHYLAELLAKRGTPDQMWCYHTFGEGHIELKFEWTGHMPKIQVTVCSKFGHPAECPADQAHRTWQRLRAKCLKNGITEAEFDLIVTFATPKQMTISRADFELIQIAMMPEGEAKEARIEQFLRFVPEGMTEYVGYALRYLRYHVEKTSVS